MTPPIVVISAPNHLAATIGGALCARRGGGIWTKQTPHRTLFVVPLLLVWGVRSIMQPGVVADWFWTHEEALGWSEREARAWEAIQ